MYVENFSAMATQAAVLAGFTTTCLIEISIPDNANPIAKNCLHICAIFSICSNIACVSLSTITTIWGSGKALRGKDGSMDEAVEGINNERPLIFKAFAFGLGGNLCTVLCACFITMDYPTNFIAGGMVLYTAWLIYGNAIRIQKRFHLSDVVRLDDLTAFPGSHNNNNNNNNHKRQANNSVSLNDADYRDENHKGQGNNVILGNRSRKALIDVV